MAEPTNEQLKAYADKLPDVYRTALAAFIQRYEDGISVRRAGTSVKFSRIRTEVQEVHPALQDTDVKTMLDQLLGRDFLKLNLPYDHEDFTNFQFWDYIPTLLGERLIAAVTGVEPVPEAIPALPEPVWA